MSRSTWHTLADGTKIGWEGVGGVPLFAPDFASGSLRLPDLRGMYAEAAGFDSLDVCGVHGDGIREFSGYLGLDGDGFLTAARGAFSGVTRTSPVTHAVNGSANWALTGVNFVPSAVTPTANKVQGRAWGALACVYLGKPAR